MRLSGRNTFAGPAIVEKGALEITGSLASATRVEAGGALAGTGTVRDVAVAAGGSLAPGSVDGGGTLAVDGSLTLAKDSALMRRAVPHDPTFARVKGRVSLDGAKLVVFSLEPVPPGTRLTVLEAEGGISGTFAEAVLDMAKLKPKLTYTATAVYLTFDPGAGALASP